MTNHKHYPGCWIVRPECAPMARGPKPAGSRRRTFTLVRDVDISGVSGTGTICEGVQFSDGAVALRWYGPWPTCTFHELGISSVRAVHGHGNLTHVVWDC